MSSAPSSPDSASRETPVRLGNATEFLKTLKDHIDRAHFAAQHFTADSSLTSRFTWKDTVFMFETTRDDARPAKRPKPSRACPSALSNYNSYLRTVGLFERLCEDLRVPADSEVSFRKRLAAVEGVSADSPWISVARGIWSKLTNAEKAAIQAAGEEAALGVLLETAAYKNYITDHVVGA